MPAFQINDAEWSALVEEPGDIFLVYCSIRRYMDYETGIAGVRRRFSEQMLREVLYVAPTRGRHESGSPTRQRVRSVLDRLISLGVLLPAGPMVYQLPLATRDGLSETSATEQQPDQQPDQQPVNNRIEASKDGALKDSAAPSATTSESGSTANSNLPPISGKTTSTGNARGAFAMPLTDWEPDPKSFKAFAFANSVPANSLTPEALAAFRTYWHVRPEREQTQAQWEQQLVSHLKHQLRQAQAGGYSYGSATGSAKAETNNQRSSSGQRGRQGDGSAVDKVKSAIRDRKAREASASIDGQALDQDDGDVRPSLDGEFRRIS